MCRSLAVKFGFYRNASVADVTTISNLMVLPIKPENLQVAKAAVLEEEQPHLLDAPILISTPRIETPEHRCPSAELAQVCSHFETSLCHPPQPVVNIEIKKVRPSVTQRKAWLSWLPLWFRSSRCYHQVANVLGVGAHPLSAGSTRWMSTSIAGITTAEPADTSLFFSLTQGDMCQVSVAVCVATRLKPTLQLGMEEQ